MVGRRPWATWRCTMHAILEYRVSIRKAYAPSTDLSCSMSSLDCLSSLHDVVVVVRGEGQKSRLECNKHSEKGTTPLLVMKCVFNKRLQFLHNAVFSERRPRDRRGRSRTRTPLELCIHPSHLVDGQIHQHEITGKQTRLVRCR